MRGQWIADWEMDGKNYLGCEAQIGLYPGDPEFGFFAGAMLSSTGCI